MFVVSPIFPLVTYPMDVINAGGATMWVFCLTAFMIMIGFVQMFVAQYYLYLKPVSTYLSSLEFLCLNLVGNTDVSMFDIDIVSDTGAGTEMLTVFLFIMIYILFTMFVAIIATNYRLIYRKIEATPTFDPEPVITRVQSIFCIIPKMCCQAGPVRCIKWFCAGKDEPDEGGGENEEEEIPMEDGGLVMEEVEEVTAVEVQRRQIEESFFDKFEYLNERLDVLKVHFEAIMCRMEQLEELQSTTDHIADCQADLDDALAMHTEEVYKIVGYPGDSSPTSARSQGSDLTFSKREPTPRNVEFVPRGSEVVDH